jgi:AbiU2
MSIDHRLAKLKGHALIFSHEFRDLIESFEMLVPVAENRELLKKLSESKRKPGVGIVRWSLVQTCIIGITKLAYDKDSRNPTVRNLIEAIVDPPSRPLRDKLKDAFSIAIKAAPVPGDTPTEDDLAVWNEIEKIEVQELRESFDRYLPRLEEQWQWFSQHEGAFKELRDKRFAHVDVSLIDQQYKLREVEPPTWNTMKEAVEHLILVAEILLTILHQKDESFEQAVAIARKAATDFWEIPAT